ncbi:MAG TPA: hypothetical protein VI409_08835 [Gaiellaceae bacterium]|nr:hypothetical protein [Gaiellaceae bacterium]
MALSGEEIRRRLREFAAAWGGYAGTESSEAQTFLNGLLECYGTDRRALAHDPQESNRLLLELNRAIAAGEIDYHPFG